MEAVLTGIDLIALGGIAAATAIFGFIIAGDILAQVNLVENRIERLEAAINEILRLLAK